MDVFLEEPSGWTGVHHRLISVISDTLIEQVAPRFSVSIEERVYITDDDPATRPLRRRRGLYPPCAAPAAAPR